MINSKLVQERNKVLDSHKAILKKNKKKNKIKEIGIRI